MYQKSSSLLNRNRVLLLWKLSHDFTPIKIKPTPRKIQTIFMTEIFPTIPINPMVVVKINIIGPTSASDVLTMRAFSTELNFSINIAANISILPDINRKKAIPNTAFSIIMNIATS
jgi:hypothetical protein